MEKVACFVSIPKNASKTIHDFLGIPIQTRREDRRTPFLSENHLSIGNLQHAFPGDFSKLFTFCFSRNPYDRAVSWFFYHKECGESGFPELRIYQKTFQEWVLEGCPGHFSSGYAQYDFVKDSPEALDFIGKFETLKKDIKRLHSILEIKLSEKGISWKLHSRAYGTKTNTSEHQSYENYYDEDLKERVYALFRRDFEFFGYDK